MTPLLAALALWSVAGLAAWAAHRLTQPAPAPLPRRPVDPDRHPAPVDATCRRLEHLYRQPAWKGETR